MRRPTIVMAVVLSAVVAACSGPATIDPYELTSNAFSNPWERVQVNIGFSLATPETTVSIAPEMFRVVFDTAASKALVTVAIPADALGFSAADLAEAGIPGGRIEFDVLLDSNALYARAPFAAGVLPLLLGELGEAPDGDFSGWLRLADRDDLAALEEMIRAMQQMSGPTTPDLSEWENLAADELQVKLEGSGITLLHEGSETRNGVDAEHLAITIDYAAFADNPPFEGIDPRQLEMYAQSGMSATADVWLEKATSRPIEVLVSATSSETPAEFEFKMLFSEPDPDVNFDAPATFVDVPILELLRGMFMPFGPGGFDDDFDGEEDFDFEQELEFDFDGDYFGEN